MLWPVLRSAAELLACEDRERVGQCADDRGCDWLFCDSRRNHSRRWCNVEDCGNRAKARRLDARGRAQAPASWRL
jgi:predicted RNA-binding Zn ribbon-like protein